MCQMDTQSCQHRLTSAPVRGIAGERGRIGHNDCITTMIRARVGWSRCAPESLLWLSYPYRWVDSAADGKLGG